MVEKQQALEDPHGLEGVALDSGVAAWKETHH